MKKFMFAAMAALAITSCSQNEEVDAPASKAEISFGTIVRTSTKAVVATTSNLEEFTVSGFKTVDAMGAGVTLAAGFMDDVKVTKKGEKWESSTFYWPLTGKVQFFATAPAQTLDIQSSGYPKFEYTVGTTDTQNDLVAANLIDKDKTNGAVVLPFQHLLTQVNFSIKGDMKDFTYTVTGLELTGVKDKGTFTFDGTDNVGSWGTVTASGVNLTYSYSGSVVVAPTTAEPGLTKKIETEGNALFMLMPQTNEDIKLKITYSAAPTDKSTEFTFNDSKTIVLTGDFEQGKNIRYTLKLTSDASPVTFGNPSIGEWGTEEPR